MFCFVRSFVCLVVWFFVCLFVWCDGSCVGFCVCLYVCLFVRFVGRLIVRLFVCWLVSSFVWLRLVAVLDWWPCFRLLFFSGLVFVCLCMIRATPRLGGKTSGGCLLGASWVLPGSPLFLDGPWVPPAGERDAIRFFWFFSAGKSLSKWLQDFVENWVEMATRKREIS